MTVFGLKSWVNPLGKMSIFRPFKSFCFYSLERRFFILEYRERHFPGLYQLNKKCEKWQILDQSHGLTPLQKCQFFNFLKFLFLQPRRAFSVLEYRKRHFPGLFGLKEKVRKKAIFGLKPWVTRWENVNFSTFESLVFIAKKSVFLFQNILKDIFLAYIA